MQPHDFEAAMFESAEFESADFEAAVSFDDPLADAPTGNGIERDCAEELTAVESGFRQRAKEEERRKVKATDSEFWVCLCFQSREEVEAFMRASQWGPISAKYLDGRKVADKCRIKFERDDTPYGKARVDAKFESRSLEVPHAQQNR